jgi:hypothetical protein
VGPPARFQRKKASPRSRRMHPSRAARGKGLGGAGRRREGAQARSSDARERGGAGGWLSSRRPAGAAELLPDGGRGDPIGPHDRRIPGFMTPGVGARVSRTTRDGWAPGGHSGRGINPGSGCSSRETEPGIVVEQTLEGKRKAQESTDRRGFARKGGGRDENGLPGGARLRSGRPGRSPVSHGVDGKRRSRWPAQAGRTRPT